MKIPPKLFLLGTIYLFLFSGVLIAQGIDLKNVTIDGDFRYRHEVFNQEDVDNFNRQQIRTRLRLTAAIANDLDFIVQIASGEGNAPFSTDQTLGNSFSSKPLWLDKAYVVWKPAVVEGLEIVGGKAPIPMYRPNNNQLVWNPDVHVEGLSAKYSSKNNEMELFGLATSYWMFQRAGEDDSWLYAGQGGLKYAADAFSLTTGAGYLIYTNAKGNPTYFNVNNSFGNSIDSTGNYCTDFNLVEGFLELSAAKFTIYANVVLNTGADEDNLAYIAGIKKTINLWTFNYNYRQIEKDALIGILNDPDIADGLTDSNGHKLGISLKLTDKIVTDFTYIHSTMGISDGKYYRRAQLAFNVSF